MKSRGVLPLCLVAAAASVVAACGRSSSGPKPAYTIAGTIAYVAPGGITLSLTGANSATTTTDATGAYSFSGVPNGSYTVAPSRSGLTFQPASMSVTVSGGDVVGRDFTASGFTLLDALTGSTLDGSKFRDPLLSRSLVNGALVLKATGTNLESSTVRGVRPSNSVAISGMGPSRVTTWGATITVPSGSTTRTGTATVQSAVAIVYQPLVNRLAFPAAQANLIVAQLGLQDAGAGLVFFRNVALCTDASCSTSDSETNIVYDDGAGATVLPVGQAASPDTAYVFSLALDEATRVFTYTISGGGLGTRTGTADASALFAAQVVDPAADFSNAQLRVRVFDPGAAGGGSGTVVGVFDDVQRGVAGAGATLYDGFASPTFDFAKWSTGEGSSALDGTGLVLAASARSEVAGVPASSGIAINGSGIPTAANQVKVDVTILADTPAAGTGSTNHFAMNRTLYNDGSPGLRPAPDVNEPGSMVGDVFGQMLLSATTASFDILHSQNATGTSNVALTNPGATELTPSAAHPLGVGTTHTLLMAWDPAAHTITFQLDDAAPVVVDPTTTADPHMAIAAPVVQAKRIDFTNFISASIVSPMAPAGANGSIAARLANINFQ